MVLLRALLYIGFVVAVVASWVMNRQKHSETPKEIRPKATTTFESVESVFDALNRSEWQTRLAAVAVIKADNHPYTLEHLLSMLNDPVFDIREAVAKKIATYGNQALDGLDDILQNGSLNARESAIEAVCDIGTPETVDILIRALQNDDSAWVRIPAVYGLKAIGGESAREALQHALKDPHPDVVKTVERIINT